MINKKVFIAPVLLFGLAACNNDTDNALDNPNRSLKTANGDQNLYRVNNRDITMDHQGPLTEDYTDDNGRNNNNRNNVTRTSRKTNVTNDNISSYNTTKSSNSYPQTRAILIQEAKYKYVPINQRQALELIRRNQNRQIAQAPAALEEQQTTPGQQQQQTAQRPANINQAVQQVIDLTNQQRRQNGLPALQADTQLNGVAQKKSDDMQQNHYFSHTSPTYGSPFDMMRDFGVTYRSAGENIAQGQKTPQEVLQSWMNSEGHRKNILSRDFTHIGVGFDQTGYHWTQMFIGK